MKYFEKTLESKRPLRNNLGYIEIRRIVNIINFLCGMVDQWKVLVLFTAKTAERSSHYSSDTQSPQNMKLLPVKWICGVVITNTPPCQVSVLFLPSFFGQKFWVKQSSLSVWGNYLKRWSPQTSRYFYNFWNFVDY